MKEDEIIELARQAGVRDSLEYDHMECDAKSLEAFAKLVAKHTLMNIDPSKFISWQEGFEAGRFAEREGCAKWFESIGLQSEADAVRKWDKA